MPVVPKYPEFIPYGRQHIDDEDIAAVVDTLKSDFLTQGPKVPEFESQLCHLTGAQFACATNSATSALHLACLALNVGTGDIVWTSPISFVASSNCALYCNATVDFVDVDTNTGLMSINALTKKLADAEKTNTLPKVVIPVHLCGHSCDMKAMATLAKQYSFRIIEDASHAVGSFYQGKPVGSCQYSDISIFSFHPVKIITSAEGGIALTNKQSLADKMSKLRSHGITNVASEMTEPSHGPWYYQQQMLGFNYRMTELQAALGVSQLKKLKPLVSKRNAKAVIYDEAFANTDLTILEPADNSQSSYHLYVVLLPQRLVNEHRNIIEKMREANICAHLHYIPIHIQPFYQTLGFNEQDFPNAMDYYHRAISIPLYPDLDSKAQQFIIDTIKEML